MADTSHGTGGVSFDSKKRSWPNELNIFIALIVIVLLFEVAGQLLPYMKGQSMLFDFNTNRDGTILNMARLKIMILQVAIIGIISLGVTQVIILGGIDLSSGPLVGGSPRLPSSGIADVGIAAASASSVTTATAEAAFTQPGRRQERLPP